MKIQRLINNPNAYSLSQLKDYVVQQPDNAYDICNTVGQEELYTILNSQLPTAAPNAVVLRDTQYRGSTLVFVWGTKASGKSSVIGTLLAEKKDSIKVRTDEATPWTAAVRDMFVMEGADSKVVNPMLEDEDVCQSSVLNVSQRHGIFTRRYSLSFVEVLIDDVLKPDSVRNELISSPNEQIHIFCIDPLQDIDQQARQIRDVIDYLDGKRILKTKTNGIYILVTKTDTMYRVPREYRDKAAQSMITLGQRSLWQKVRNICFSKGIYGAMPVVYSIGEVKYQNIITTPSHNSAQNLWHIILNKCQPQKSLLEKVLTFGNGFVTAILFLFLLGFFGKILYQQCVPDVKPPTEQNLPFDITRYVKDAAKNEIAEADIKDATRVYDRLMKELKEEVSISKADGTPLVDTRTAGECCLILADALADRIHEEVKQQTESSDWNDSALRTCRKKCKELLDNEYMSYKKRSQILKDYEILQQYFDGLKSFLNRSSNCMSLEDVRETFSQLALYNKEPFTNDNATRQALNDAKENAINSYANKLHAEAEQLKEKWDDTDFYQIFSMEDLKDQSKQLKQDLDDLNSFISSEGGSAARDLLKSAYELLI